MIVQTEQIYTIIPVIIPQDPWDKQEYHGAVDGAKHRQLHKLRRFNQLKITISITTH